MQVSPAPKRPAAYNVPAPAGGPPMDIEAVVAELYVQRAAFSSLHEWVTSIYDSTHDHAVQIEAAAKHFQNMKKAVGQLEADTKAAHGIAESKIENVLGVAEGKIEDIFKRVDVLTDSVPSREQWDGQDLGREDTGNAGINVQGPTSRWVGTT